MRVFLENDKIKVEIDSFGAEVKSVMAEADVMELTAGAFTFTLKEITRNNVDTKTLKTKYADLYKALLKVSSYMKFEVA